jgi:hypothetical protein
MWRSTAELLSESWEVQVVTFFKFLFANHMLLLVMEGAETDHPTVRRLQANSPVRTTTNVSALNRKSSASWH